MNINKISEILNNNISDLFRNEVDDSLGVYKTYIIKNNNEYIIRIPGTTIGKVVINKDNIIENIIIFNGIYYKKHIINKLYNLKGLKIDFIEGEDMVCNF